MRRFLCFLIGHKYRLLTYYNGHPTVVLVCARCHQKKEDPTP